jgi:hypothetical protein
VSQLGWAAFVCGADRRDWASDRTPAGCVRSTMRRDGTLPVDFPGNGCTEHADAPACEDGPDGGTGCAVQVPYHEASQDEPPDDQAPDDPYGVGRPVLHWPAPRGWPGTHLMQEGPHSTATRIAGAVLSLSAYMGFLLWPSVSGHFDRWYVKSGSRIRVPDTCPSEGPGTDTRGHSQG